VVLKEGSPVLAKTIAWAVLADAKIRRARTAWRKDGFMDRGGRG
jgi:hypothetical protein